MVSVYKRMLYTSQQSLLKTKLRSTLEPLEDYSKINGMHILRIFETDKTKEQLSKYIWKLKTIKKPTSLNGILCTD